MKVTISFNNEKELKEFINFLKDGLIAVYGKWFGRQINKKKALIKSVIFQLEEKL